MTIKVVVSEYEPNMFEVIDIDLDGQNPSVPIVGIPRVNRLEISSWMTEDELYTVVARNNVQIVIANTKEA